MIKSRAIIGAPSVGSLQLPERERQAVPRGTERVVCATHELWWTANAPECLGR